MTRTKFYKQCDELQACYCFHLRKHSYIQINNFRVEYSLELMLLALFYLHLLMIGNLSFFHKFNNQVNVNSNHISK